MLLIKSAAAAPVHTRNATTTIDTSRKIDESLFIPTTQPKLDYSGALKKDRSLEKMNFQIQEHTYNNH